MSVSTKRTCERHPLCIVTWDYTTSGGCPVCMELKDLAEGDDYSVDGCIDELGDVIESLKELKRRLTNGR